MNGTKWQIEQGCPQCGAPVTLDETDRLLACPFCRTRLYLVPEGHFRYHIPPAAGNRRGTPLRSLLAPPGLLLQRLRLRGDEPFRGYKRPCRGSAGFAPHPGSQAASPQAPLRFRGHGGKIHPRGPACPTGDPRTERNARRRFPSAFYRRDSEPDSHPPAPPRRDPLRRRSRETGLHMRNRGSGASARHARRDARSGPLRSDPLSPLRMGHGGGKGLSGSDLPELQLGLGLSRANL